MYCTIHLECNHKATIFCKSRKIIIIYSPPPSQYHEYQWHFKIIWSIIRNTRRLIKVALSVPTIMKKSISSGKAIVNKRFSINIFLIKFSLSKSAHHPTNKKRTFLSNALREWTLFGLYRRRVICVKKSVRCLVIAKWCEIQSVNSNCLLH